MKKQGKCLAGAAYPMVSHQARIEGTEIILARLEKKDIDSKKQGLRKALEGLCTKLLG